MSLQVEIHVNLSPKEVKASIILNKLRLIGVFDLLQSLKCFVIDGLSEEQEIGGCGSLEGGYTIWLVISMGFKFS